MISFGTKALAAEGVSLTTFRQMSSKIRGIHRLKGLRCCHHRRRRPRHCRYLRRPHRGSHSRVLGRHRRPCWRGCKRGRRVAAWPRRDACKGPNKGTSSSASVTLYVDVAPSVLLKIRTRRPPVCKQPSRRPMAAENQDAAADAAATRLQAAARGRALRRANVRWSRALGFARSWGGVWRSLQRASCLNDAGDGGNLDRRPSRS